MDGAPPDFFVVGAPKCGTTALHAYLKQHPGVFMPETKELHYYGRDLARLPSSLTAESHADLFRGWDGATVAGETCIWALYSQGAAREIRAAHPNARVVAMVRHPIEMMYALHSEFIYHAIEDVADFARALDAAPDRLAGRRLPCGDLFPPAIYDYRAVATFSPQLERYIGAFGRDRVHVIGYTDFRRDTAGEYRRLLNFLGADPSFSPGFPVVNPNKRVRSVYLQHLLYNTSRPGLERLTRWVPSPSARRWVASTAARWNVTSTPRPPMNPRLRARLETEFAPEIDRLSRLIGRDLSAASKSRAA